MIQQVHSHPDIYRIRVDLPDNSLQYLNSYVIKGVSGNLVIDTGFNRPECKRALCQGLQELDIRLQSDTSLFITHLHADHSGLVGLFAATGCPVYMHPVDYQYLVDSEDGSTWKAAEDNFMREGMPPAEIKTQFSNQARTFSPDPHFPVNPVHDGDCLHLAGCDLQVIHTPGHTPGGLSLYGEGVVFSGDTLFRYSVGRTDLYGGSSKTLLHSLETKLMTLPDNTLVLPGHGPATSIGDERRGNPFLDGGW